MEREPDMPMEILLEMKTLKRGAAVERDSKLESRRSTRRMQRKSGRYVIGARCGLDSLIGKRKREREGEREREREREERKRGSVSHREKIRDITNRNGVSYHHSLLRSHRGVRTPIRRGEPRPPYPCARSLACILAR